jgi:hypothetical protein
MLPTNPITLPSGIDPNIEAERHIQSLFQLWLERYFSGIPFNSPDADGNPVARTFTACTIDTQEADLPANPDKPVIHLSFNDPANVRRDFAATSNGQDITWPVLAMVKIPASFTNADITLRTVADQFAWLINSHEKSALMVHGVNYINHISGPAIMPPANGWLFRFITFTCRTRRETPRPL